MKNWISATEAAEVFGTTRKTIYRAVKRLPTDKTKIEAGIRYLDRQALRQTIRKGPKGHRRDIVPQRSLPLSQDSIGQSQDELHQAIRERLDDLRTALEHERAIARSLADQNSMLVEQNRRLLEQVDDLTALSLRLGMAKQPPTINV